MTLSVRPRLLDFPDRSMWNKGWGVRDQHVREAADGYEALRMLEQGGTDLVVLDLRLPRINGFTEASKYLACGRAAAKCCDESTDDVIDPYEHWISNCAADAR